jgi:endonuclease
MSGYSHQTTFRRHEPGLRPPQKNPSPRNIEGFVVQQLEAIEPGLRLVDRQLSTLAGRLDLLCKDASGSYVVVELKRMQGTDQVVGQILRYMGWVREFYHTEKVRGIIIVGKKDPTLKYAVMAAPNVQAKEFKLLIH